MRKIERKYENPIDNVLIDLIEIVSPTFYKLGFNANGITTLSLIFGLMSILFLYKGYIYFFMITYFISYFFDCMDGYFARQYKCVSKFGDYYDHIKDVSVFIGLLIVIFLKYRCSPITIFVATILLITGSIIMNMHLGCQEKIYATTKCDESPSLSKLKHMCPGNPEDSIKYLRYFGTGTYTVLFILVIFVVHRICKIK
jgi:hypothetical protein